MTGVDRRVGFGYPGGKYKLSLELMRYFPKNAGVYVEPFAGRGNVFWCVAHHIRHQFTGFWLNDIKTAPFFWLLKGSTPAELKDYVLGDTGYEYPGEEEYQWLSAHRNTPRAVVMESFLTFSGGGWGAGYCCCGKSTGTVEGYLDKVLTAGRVLRDLDMRVTALDYSQVLEQCGPRDFVYLDPPYMNTSVRSYSSTQLCHRSMVNTLLGAKYAWALSEYLKPRYLMSLGPPIAKWSQRLSVTGSEMSAVDRRRVECLWAYDGERMR